LAIALTAPLNRISIGHQMQATAQIRLSLASSVFPVTDHEVSMRTALPTWAKL
jgi:hypothetical protein